MAFVRTFFIILALVLGWGAVRADPDMVFGLLGCALPMTARWGRPWLPQRLSNARRGMLPTPSGAGREQG